MEKVEKVDFKEEIQRQFREVKSNIIVIQPDGLTFEKAQEIAWSVGGTMGKFPQPQGSKEIWFVCFDSIAKFTIKCTEDFTEDIMEKIEIHQKFLYRPRVYKYPLETIDFKDAILIVESLGGTLRQSAIKGVWRIDFTSLFDDFKEYVYDHSITHSSFSIKKSDCPLITQGMVKKVIDTVLTHHLTLIEDEDEWKFARTVDL